MSLPAKPVKIFVMGANQWREEDDWPLARAQSTKYFLHSAKRRELAARRRQSSPPLRLDRSRRIIMSMILSNPAPTIGGPLCCDGQHLAPGPRDQRPVEARDDVLIYTTPAFAQDTEVTGPVSLELFAQSSAVDTDFRGQAGGRWSRTDSRRI